jgi:hypothetical protein
MGLTKARNVMVTGADTNVKDYGAVADYYLTDGITLNPSPTDNTAFFQAAIDAASNRVYIEGGDYLVASGLEIRDRKKLKIYGEGRLYFTPTVDKLFDIVGVVTDFELSGLTMVGVNTNLDATNVTAVGNASGQTITRCVYKDLKINDFNIGISINADLSGSAEDCIVTDCLFSNIEGELPGRGYGVHMSRSSNTLVLNNRFHKTGRHAVYVSNDTFSVVKNNLITSHRSVVFINQIRAAIFVARGSEGTVIDGNRVSNFKDGAISVTTESGTLHGDMTGIVVTNNTFVNAGNLIQAMSIGVPGNMVTGDDALVGLSVTNNTFVQDHNVFAAPGIYLYNGVGVDITNNKFILQNPASGNAIVLGSSFTISVDTMNSINVTKNHIIARNATGTITAVRINPALCTTASIVATARDNTITSNLTGNFYVNNAVLVTNQHLNTNSNNTQKWEEIRYSNAAPTIGTWDRGTKFYNQLATAGGTMGFVCVTAGTPGTWKTFGAITV